MLKATLELGIEEIEVYRNSILVRWKTKDEKLLPCNEHWKNWQVNSKMSASITYLEQKINFMDALTTLASMVQIPNGINVHPFLIEEINSLTYCFNMLLQVDKKDNLPRYQDIQNFLKHRVYLENIDRNDRHKLRNWLVSL